MPSATDFLPSSITEFMNFDRTISPNFGSGRISRFSGRRRRAIGLFLSLQPVPEHVRGLLKLLLGTLGAVLGARLPAILDPLGVEDAAEHVIANTWKVANTAAADQHHAVFLEVVALARDVADHFALVGQADLGHLAQSRIRLLRGRRIDTGANAALLRVLLHRRDLRLGLLRFATLADQLVDRWHEALHLSLPESRRLLCSTEKARNLDSLHGRLATRMLSNVQLLPGNKRTDHSRADGGHIAVVPCRVNQRNRSRAATFVG